MQRTGRTVLLRFRSCRGSESHRCVPRRNRRSLKEYFISTAGANADVATLGRAQRVPKMLQSVAAQRSLRQLARKTATHLNRWFTFPADRPSVKPVQRV